ncbi:MAG: hypothetical protein R6W70_03215 [bacterium]
MFFNVFYFFICGMLFVFTACSENVTRIAEEENPDDLIVIPEDESESSDEDKKPDEDVVISDEAEHFAGFAHIPPVNYSLNGQERESDAARLWYSFQTADENADEKPIFVFYNGGPGSATALLFTYNTGKYTADQAFATDDSPVTENPFSWTEFGNVMYIDARHTGFSYGITDDPSDSSERSSGFSTDNLNTFFDAADFLRVLFDLYSRMPVLKDNPIIMSGESYGGVRSTLMINMMLYYGRYMEGEMDYYDKELFDMIDNHFHALFPEVEEDYVPPRLIASLFPAQVMIQPLVSGRDQMEIGGEMLENDPESAPYEIAGETGSTFTPCSSDSCDPYNNILSFVQKNQRDPYCYRREADWLFDYVDVGIEKALQYDELSLLLGYDPKEIQPMYAENREQAYRYAGNIPDYLNGAYFSETDYLFDVLPPAEALKIKLRIDHMRKTQLMMTGNMESVFGELQPWDTYFIDLNRNITPIFYMTSPTPYSGDTGRRFVENLMFVKTLITDAKEDMVIYTPAIPESIKKFRQVDSVTVEDQKFTVHFDENFLPEGADSSAEVALPHYPDSCHPVTVTEPEKMLNDLRKWLSE